MVIFVQACVRWERGEPSPPGPPKIRTIFYLGIICLILAGCSRMERSEQERIRRLNCKGEPIYRACGESFYPIETPTHTPRSAYPWESEDNLPKISKEFFRCKGNIGNPSLLIPNEPNPLTDCNGSACHGLPIIHGKERIYPVLVDLLNYVQKKTGKRVVITCGHRCPAHNTYADPSKENQTSKHQIGAEVDFYVQGMEERPLEIAGLIMQYFQEMPAYAQDKECLEFKRYLLGDSKTAIQPWMNKEIFMKIYQKDEGRDHDNRHPYPYLCLQVRFDKETKEKVVYNWAKAHQGYPRF